MMAPTITGMTADMGCRSSPETLNVSNAKPGNLPGQGLRDTAQLFITNMDSRKITSKITRVTSSNCERENEVQRKLGILSQQVKAVKEKRNQHLMSVCLKTLELSSKNRRLQEELNELRDQTKAFTEALKPTMSGTAFRPQLTKSITHMPFGVNSQTDLTTAVPVPSSLTFPGSSNIVQFRSTIGSGTCFTSMMNPLNQKLVPPVPPSNNNSSGINTSQIHQILNNLGGSSPNPLIVISNGQHTKDKAASTPGYGEVTDSVVDGKMGTKISQVTVSTNISTISDVSDTFTSKGGPGSDNSNSTKGDSKVFCSCCSEDSHNSQTNFYTLLNDVAANWINRLNGTGLPTRDSNSTVESTTSKGSPPPQGLYKKELFHNVSSALAHQVARDTDYSLLPIQISRKRFYVSSKDDDPMISAKRRNSGSESSFGSLSCASPLLNPSDVSEDEFDTMRVDAADIIQLTSMDDLEPSEDSD